MYYVNGSKLSRPESKKIIDSGQAVFRIREFGHGSALFLRQYRRTHRASFRPADGSILILLQFGMYNSDLFRRFGLGRRWMGLAGVEGFDDEIDGTFWRIGQVDKAEVFGVYVFFVQHG